MAGQQLADALARAGIESLDSKANGNCFVLCRTPDGQHAAIWQSRQEDNPGRPIVFGTRAELESLEQGFRNGEFAWDKLPVAVETENVPAGKNS